MATILQIKKHALVVIILWESVAERLPSVSKAETRSSRPQI